MPDVRGTYEDYPVGMVKYWQARESVKSVQVVVLRDPAGEQEARFDLHHGASLISLRYHGEELLFSHSAGANVEMFVFRKDTAPGALQPLTGRHFIQARVETAWVFRLLQGVLHAMEKNP